MPTAFSGGCAALIAESGTDLSKLKTREEVHAKLGDPVAGGKEDETFFDDYFTHRKIASWNVWWMRGNEGYALAVVLTLGTFDLLFLPEELYKTAKRTIAGQNVRFTYDNNGRVIRVRSDGQDEENREFTRHMNPNGVPASEGHAPESRPAIPPLPDPMKN